MGCQWVLFLLSLNVVLSWPEDDRLQPKHAAKYNLIVITVSCLDVCCVLTVCNILYMIFLFLTLKKTHRVIQKNGLNWTVNGASTHARRLVAVFQVLCSLYGLTCVSYAQNSLQFVSRSPLIHMAGRIFCLYTDSRFAQIGDSNDKCSSSLEGWMLKRRRKARCTAVGHSVFNELTNV